MRRGILTVLLALAGCAPFPQPPAASSLPVPTDWRFANGSVQVDAQWWRNFDDPNLSAVVTEALANNTDIAQAVERVQQARAIQRGAKAELGPEIDVQNTGGYTRIPGVPAARTAFTTPELTLSWDLDLFGRLKQADLAQRAIVLSTAASRDEVRLDVASTAASGYIALLALDERLAIVEENLELRRQFLHTATRRAAAGYTSALELKQAQSEYETDAALIPATRLSIAQAEDALSILLGKPPRPIFRTPAGLAAMRMPAVPGGLPSSLLRQRPDVWAAQQALLAADHSLRSARANLLPDFALTGDVGGSISQLLPQAQLEYLIGGIVLAPVFDSGRRQATIDVARAARDQAAYSYKGVVLDALRDVEDALVAIAKNREQMRQYDQQVDTQRQELAVARERYLAGYAPYFDQIDAERQLLAAQLNLQQTRNALLGAYTALYAALGGGWHAETLHAAER